MTCEDCNNYCKRCGVLIPGDGTEWADWTNYCHECEAELMFEQEFEDDE